MCGSFVASYSFPLHPIAVYCVVACCSDTFVWMIHRVSIPPNVWTNSHASLTEREWLPASCHAFVQYESCSSVPLCSHYYNIAVIYLFVQSSRLHLIVLLPTHVRVLAQESRLLSLHHPHIHTGKERTTTTYTTDDRTRLGLVNSHVMLCSLPFFASSSSTFPSMFSSTLPSLLVRSIFLLHVRVFCLIRILPHPLIPRRRSSMRVIRRSIERK